MSQRSHIHLTKEVFHETFQLPDRSSARRWNLVDVGVGHSSEGTHGPKDGLLTAKLSMEEAIATAKAKFPGQVLEAEFENEHGQTVYEIEIASTTGVVTEIKVDAQSGELLSSAIEDQDEREKSEGKDKD
jgi:uncharacterized membrane protein YkoI